LPSPEKLATFIADWTSNWKTVLRMSKNTVSFNITTNWIHLLPCYRDKFVRLSKCMDKHPVFCSFWGYDEFRQVSRGEKSNEKTFKICTLSFVPFEHLRRFPDKSLCWINRDDAIQYFFFIPKGMKRANTQLNKEVFIYVQYKYIYSRKLSFGLFGKNKINSQLVS